MVQINDRVKCLVQLGEFLSEAKNNTELLELIKQATQENEWFTRDFILLSLSHWGNILTEKNIRSFLADYHLKPEIQAKKVGIVMAGNIPIVGMHDLVMLILSGHKAVIKMSSKDQVLPKYIYNTIKEINPNIAEKIEFSYDFLKSIDALIATGSNNTARYFNQYFGKIPNIIRQNRNSVAVLTGDESEETLKKLADDVFAYFGMGCRNITKVYLPNGYDLTKLMDAFEGYSYFMEHHKYMNNYIYQKAILLMDMQAHLDNDFLLLRENKAIYSPVSVLHYEYYSDLHSLSTELEIHTNQIQCISCNTEILPNTIAIGNCQKPELKTFADGIDSMNFLLNLS